MSEPRDGADDLEQLDAADEFERAEAEALARALDGAYDADAPEDALGASALLRGVARAGTHDARLDRLERDLLRRSPTPIRGGREPRRGTPLAVASMSVLAVAATAWVFLTVLPETAPSRRSRAASAGPASVASPSAPQRMSPEVFATTRHLVDSERALLDSSRETRASALLVMRDAMRRARDARLQTLLDEHGVTP